MFIVNFTDGTTLSESKDCGWRDIPENIKSVYLFHPGLKLSIGIHDCQEYAFLCEGVAMIANTRQFPRIAEHLIARRKKEYWHIILKQDGTVDTQKSRERPELNSQIWRQVIIDGS